MIHEAVACDLGFVEPKPISQGQWPVTSIALDLAGTCNLACRYCAEAASQPQRPAMTQDVLDNAVTFLLGSAPTNNGKSIRLGSGEPLLAFAMIQKLAQRLEAESAISGQRQPTVFLTTNGTLITDEIHDWLIASGWNVKVSLDGPKAVHDSWRVTPQGHGTYDKIAQTVSSLARQIPERFSVTAVMCRDSDPQEIFDGIAALGVTRIELVPVAHSDRAMHPNQNDINRYDDFLHQYIDFFLEDDGLPPAMLIGLEKCVVRYMGYNIGDIACGAGRSFVGISPEGELYPCFRFIGIDKYRIGTLYSGFDREAVREFSNGPGRTYEKRIACVQCWAATLCNGPCFACAEVFGPGVGEPIDLHCTYMRRTAEAAVRLVDRLRAKAPERLLGFLPGANDMWMKG